MLGFAKRILKLKSVWEIELYGKDQDGDNCFVKIKGEEARQILTFLQECLKKPPTKLVLEDKKDESEST